MENTNSATDDNVKQAETWQTSDTTRVEVDELVYSSNKVKIYYTGSERNVDSYNGGYSSLNMYFRIENGYDESIEWYTGSIKVNGISLTIANFEYINANSTEACSILVDAYKFKKARINDYNEVQLIEMDIEGRTKHTRYEKDISFTIKVFVAFKSWVV